MFKKALLLTLLFLLGCSSQERQPGVLYLRLASDPTTLDPAYIVDVSGGGVAAKLFDGLVQFDRDANIVPDIAEKYEISPDGKVYTFHLRHGVKFSNGREVTSGDFKYTFERVLSPDTNSPRTWLFDRIKGAKNYMEKKATDVSGLTCPDDYTLKVELDAPFGPFLGLLAMPGGYAVPKEEVEKWGKDFSDHPAGAGPYTLSKWEHGSRLRLTANPAYFGTKPMLNGMVYRIIPEDLTSVAEFERGNLDTVDIPAPEFRRYVQSPKWRDNIVSQVGINTYYLGFNCSRPPFNNPDLRRAVSMAIDRKRILNTIYERRGVLAYGPVPQTLLPLPACCIAAFPYTYDPEGARRLIDKAGARGLKVKIYVGAVQETVDMVEVIQQYLKDIGIDASIVQLEWSAYKQAINDGDADAFWMSWQADYPDPENFLFPVFYSGNAGPAGNRARFNDPDFDSIIQQAQSEPDPAKRRALYRQAQARVVAMAPWVFFWHKMDFSLHQPWVTGYRLYPINNADKGLGVGLSGRPSSKAS